MKKNFAESYDEFSSILFSHNEKSIQESLCLLYVAMTRAKYALHIIIGQSHQKIDKNGKLPQQAKLLNFATILLEITESFDSKVKTPWAIGKKQWLEHFILERSVEKTKVVIPELKLFKFKSQPTEPRFLLKKNPSSKEQVRSLLDCSMQDENNNFLERGSLFHLLFEQITWLDERDLTLDFISILPRSLTEDDRLAFAKEFIAMISEPIIAKHLSKEAYRDCRDIELYLEYPLLMREDQFMISGIIDRLVIYCDNDGLHRADIIDYKTGYKDSEQFSMMHLKNCQQLEFYKAFIEQKYQIPIHRIKAKLLYLERKEVFEF